MDAKQLSQVFARAITGAVTPKRAATPAQKRKVIAQAQITSLERVIAAIREKARETPAWKMGYFSAITAVEFEIAAIRSENNIR